MELKKKNSTFKKKGRDLFFSNSTVRIFAGNEKMLIWSFLIHVGNINNIDISSSTFIIYSSLVYFCSYVYVYIYAQIRV